MQLCEDAYGFSTNTVQDVADGFAGTLGSLAIGPHLRFSGVSDRSAAVSRHFHGHGFSAHGRDHQCHDRRGHRIQHQRHSCHDQRPQVAELIVVLLSAVQFLGQGNAMVGYRYTLAAIAKAQRLFSRLGGARDAGLHRHHHHGQANSCVEAHEFSRCPPKVNGTYSAHCFIP